MIAGVCATFGAASIGLAGSSLAGPFSDQFQSPSGDIACNLVNSPPLGTHTLGANFVQCDIANHSWVPPRPPPPGRADATSTFVLMRGQVPVVAYGPGNLVNPDPMDDGEARFAGVITCSSDQSAMKCTDVSTGHFFRVSQESYELG
ncbi:MAG: hypothetical protein WA285_07725 [Mycobacterium sp.]